MYRSDNGWFAEPQFNDAVQTCRQHISYRRVGSHYQNIIVEHSIKELTLGSFTPLLHDQTMAKSSEYHDVALTLHGSVSEVQKPGN